MNNGQQMAATAGAIAVSHALNILKEMPHGGNLVSYGQAAEVVPMCLVDEACSTSELLEPTLQTLLSVYAGYYFRAFTMHNISIGGSSIQKRLDKFSTARSGAMYLPGMEEFENGLPQLKELEDDIFADLKDLQEEGERIEKEAIAMMQVASEGIAGDMRDTFKNSRNNTADKAINRALNKGSVVDNGSGQTTGSAKKGTEIDLSLRQSDITGPVNFATGMTVNLKIMENGNCVTVPVNIRLSAMYIAPSPLVAILGFSANDISLGARWKKWRLGGIDFWRDLVMCQDLIDEHKKNIAADKTGIYLKMMNRRRQNSVATLMSGEASANNSSNIVVMSEETAAALEIKTGGRLDDFRFRERVFAQGYGMLFAIISQRKGRVRFYTRGIPEHTEVSERDMKAATKGSNGPDVGDILNAFRAGSSFRM